MTPPGGRPGRRTTARPGPAAAILVTLALVAAGTAGGAAGASATTTTAPPNPWVAGIGGSLTLGLDRAPTGCNPNAASGNTWADHLVLEPVLPSSFVVGPGGVPSYDSAVINQAEVVNTSPQTVVYTINPKAVWSDGVPITAADFVYAWQEQRGPPPGGVGSYNTDVASTQGYRDISSVKGSQSGRTVTVVFAQPFADWKMLFNDLLPAHVMEKVGWDPGCTSVDPAVDLSGGPFKIGSVEPGKKVVLVRNPRWWGQDANLDTMTIRFASGPAQLTRWLETGAAQVIQPSAFGPSLLEQVTQHPSQNSSVTVSSTFLQLAYSTTSAVTGDLRVRQAISHAVDRQALTNTVVGWADTGIVPSASHLYAQSLSNYPGPKTPSIQASGQPGTTTTTTPNPPTTARPFPLTADLDQTDRLLNSAGYVRGPSGAWVQPNGKPLVVTVAVDEGDQWAAKSATLVARQLEAAGIAVSLLSSSDATAAGQALASGQADAALLPYDATPYGSEAIAWYTTMLGTPGVDGSQDWSRFSDPALDSLLTQASQNLNPVKAATMYADADTILWQQMVTLPLFAEPVVMAWSTYTAGVGPNPNGPGLLWYPQTWSLRVPPTSPNTVPTT
ncbi:MAG: ABC transporter family substrate-binding protein [Acidimicrobiales bacterium]